MVTHVSVPRETTEKYKCLTKKYSNVLPIENQLKPCLAMEYFNKTTCTALCRYQYKKYNLTDMSPSRLENWFTINGYAAIFSLQRELRASDVALIWISSD